MQFTGTLKSWNDDRGFGFIVPTQGGQEIFVHIKAFPSIAGRPSVGQQLSFEVETTADGKKRARSEIFPARVRAPRRPRAESPAPWTLPRENWGQSPINSGASRVGKMLTHKQFRAKALDNAEVKDEYDQLSDEYTLLDEFLKARAAQSLTQTQVAEKIGPLDS